MTQIKYFIRYRDHFYTYIQVQNTVINFRDENISLTYPLKKISLQINLLKNFERKKRGWGVGGKIFYHPPSNLTLPQSEKIKPIKIYLKRIPYLTEVFCFN